MTLGPPEGRTDLRTFVACVSLSLTLSLKALQAGAAVRILVSSLDVRGGALAE
jgi:hypothetical protein